MPTGIYERKKYHREAISKSMLGHLVSKETRKKIGDANRGEWVKFKCDFCKKVCKDKKSHYKRKKRHFCSLHCYAIFRREKLPKEEHNRFGKGYSIEDRKKRIKARSILNHYLRDKKIPRPVCEVCGGKAEAHHENYDKALEVRWLCFKHHRQLHTNPDLLKCN